MSWALTGMWQKGQVPFRAPRREAGPASVSVRVASQRAAHRPRHAARVCRSAAAFLFRSRLFPGRRAEAPACVPLAVTDDRFALVVADGDAARALLRAAGASEIRAEGAAS